MIGDGAIGGYVRRELEARGHELRAILLRPARLAKGVLPDDGVASVGSVDELPGDLEHMIDCAGHEALATYGAAILRRGFDLTTVSVGALADDRLAASLEEAAVAGGSRLHLVSGAVGALDCLRAARTGRLDEVSYTGRKPPAGWKGSPAERTLDLDRLSGAAVTHFEGSAREAAIAYPKNANVAAAVALAGVGMDATRVRLIADPEVTANIHEIRASGDFGSFTFRIEGLALADNPRSSALAAMSVVETIERQSRAIVS